MKCSMWWPRDAINVSDLEKLHEANSRQQSVLIRFVPKLTLVSREHDVWKQQPHLPQSFHRSFFVQ